MKIAIIGTGNVAQALVKGLISENYEIKIGTRNVNKENGNIDILKNINSSIDITTYDNAVEFADIIILSVPGASLVEVIETIGISKFKEKILWDITNALSGEAPVNGVIKLITNSEESIAEKVQKLLPDTYVVKAMNTVGAHLMYKPKLSEQGTVFISGNDENSKKNVAEIVIKFGWNFYDSGKIESSRALEYMGQFYIAQGIFSDNWNSTFKYIQ
ncbi:NADPH-dependent F420 reductase [Apibacter sp. HY039]|uniref:NADPH-dependent F420 reductase n=1 Tax=Apibacter sp. HY039 TaxID=2501476 RepID=UPI000FEB6845|nr:NAD(P)-binding domain-containing protein [Apibacter sp. HY039]